MAVQILTAYEGTLEDEIPPPSEKYEHSEMLLYKVSSAIIAEQHIAYSPCCTYYTRQWREHDSRVLASQSYLPAGVCAEGGWQTPGGPG